MKLVGQLLGVREKLYQENTKPEELVEIPQFHHFVIGTFLYALRLVSRQVPADGRSTGRVRAARNLRDQELTHDETNAGEDASGVT